MFVGNTNSVDVVCSAVQVVASVFNFWQFLNYIVLRLR